MTSFRPDKQEPLTHRLRAEIAYMNTIAAFDPMRELLTECLTALEAQRPPSAAQGETPRTDAIIKADWHMPKGWKDRIHEHARQLERELDAERRKLADAKAQLNAGMLLSAQSASAAPDWEGELRALLAGCERSEATDEAVERARKFLLDHRTQRTERGEKA